MIYPILRHHCGDDPKRYFFALNNFRRRDRRMMNQFLTEIELSDRIHVSLATLRRWRLENRGPKFRKLGSLVRYGEYDLTQWMEAQPSGGTGEMARIPPESIHPGRFQKRG
jgi:predicted DNA-binding transcriptional regulator AlpA